jgi:IS30 family transposase
LEVVVPGVRLSRDERWVIQNTIRFGWPLGEAARMLGRPASTVYREVARNGARGYQAERAHRVAAERARRPKPLKLVANPVLAEEVTRRLRSCWSPQQISGRLRPEHPDDPNWRVSHETIYKSLYLQGRAGLDGELRHALRTGRARRRPRGYRVEGRGKVQDMVMISERPPEVEDRAVPGHWEGDLIIGTRDGSSQIGVMVERTSRFLMLLALPDNRRAETVRDVIARKIQKLPADLIRSLTWDQGKEMGQHAQFTVDTGVAVYFCDPHSPWQRGTVENTNRLLRQYFPRGADYSPLSQDDLDLVADELNQRPRKTLGYQTPAEVLNDLINTTTA